MRAPLLTLASVLTLLATGAHAASFRIAAVGEAQGACRPLASGAPAGETAYVRHLAARLGRVIEICPVKDRAAAAKALADGALDVAVLDPDAFAKVAAATRSILTVRSEGRLHRVPVVVAVKKTDGAAAGLSSLRGRSVVFAGSSEAEVALARKTMADHGADAALFSRVAVVGDGEAAAKRLRSGAADAVVLTSAAWQRLCQGERAQDNRCGDLKELWRGRDHAALALVIRRDMPDELRLELIGVHAALHLEAKEAFAWASSFIPGGAEFEPTEADALGAPGR